MFGRIVVLALLWSGSQFAFGIANGSNLQALLSEATQKQLTSQISLYSRLLNAVGMVAAIDSAPVAQKFTKQDGNILSFNQFTQTQCGAVYVLPPATFVASAKCFAGEDGPDTHRLYAKVFVEGKGWTIDPLTILYPEGYQLEGSAARLDVAVFSLEKSEEAEFAKTHTPLEMASPDTWLVPGQRVYFVAHGSKSSKDESFGEPTLKKMTYTPPPSEKQADRMSPLHIGPEEEVLTYSTEDDSPGINCLFDSGGAAVIEVREAGKPNRLLLLGSIIGRIGPDGKAAPCEAVNRYAVSSDLRFKHEWIQHAQEKMKENRNRYASTAKTYNDWRKAHYGDQDPYNLFVPTRVSILTKQIERIQRLHRHSQNRELYLFMQVEAKKRAARQFLYGNSTQPLAIAATPTRLDNPVDPWIPKVGETILEASRAHYHWKDIFSSANGYLDTTWVRIVNMGDTPIEMEELKVNVNRGNLAQKNYKLKMGVTDLQIANPNFFYDVEFYGPKQDTSQVRVFAFHKTSDQTEARLSAEIPQRPQAPVYYPAPVVTNDDNRRSRRSSRNSRDRNPPSRSQQLRDRRDGKTSIYEDYDSISVDPDGTIWFKRWVAP